MWWWCLVLLLYFVLHMYFVVSFTFHFLCVLVLHSYQYIKSFEIDTESGTDAARVPPYALPDDAMCLT